jgi:biotin synthase
VKAPLSILVAPPTLNRTKMERFKAVGVDMIGIGLDAVTEDLFRRIRTDVPAGGAGLSWTKYWEVVNDAREIFGPWKVNVHTLVGLGETDRDLVDIFCRMRDAQIFSYLFCFNPEPDSRMGEHPKSELRRWRRIQLAKHLVETDGFVAAQFDFDADDNLAALDGDAAVVERSIESGIPFMTNGCPGAGGEPGCTRPYGSYRPSEPIRDFPFVPNPDDLAGIRSDLALHELI